VYAAAKPLEVVQMFKFISKHILTGLVAILPVALTIYLLYWFAVSAEAVLGDMIRLWLPENLYRPGMGLFAGLVAAFVAGLLTHAYVVQRLFAMAERVLYRTPMVKSIYPALRDFLHYFSPDTKREFDQVVAVTIGDTGMQLIGFVTQANPEKLPQDFRAEDSVLVYLPLSYMIGGYAVLMPRSAVRPVDMSMEEAMRFSLTAGVTGASMHKAAKK
jgi:uncharacterized membrane protein